MSELRHYYVVSPEYGVMDVIVDGQGPMEYGCEVIEVDARTKREAIIKGVAIARKNTRYDSYFNHEWDGSSPPWKGWHAELAEELVDA